MAQGNREMYSGRGPKLIHHVSPPHLMLPFHTKRRVSEPFICHSVRWKWKEPAHSKLSSQTQRTETARQVLCAICYTDSFTEQAPLPACPDRGHTDLAYTPGRAQEGLASPGSYQQVTLLSDLVCVTAKPAELRPSASIKRTRVELPSEAVGADLELTENK